MPALPELQTQERQLRNTLEMTRIFIKRFKSERDEAQIEVRLAMLEETLAKFYEVRRKIEMLTEVVELDLSAAEKEEKHEEQVVENRETVWEFENMYCEVKAALSQLLSKRSVSSSSAPKVTSSSTSRVKLPDIKLPTFSGKAMQWITFRDTFGSLIHNNEALSPIDKFTYLKTSLVGEALQEISSIEMTVANYQVAWTTLEKRYENKKLILKTHLDAIFAVEPVRKECFEALNHVVSTFDKNLQMIHKLGVETKTWSILIAYILSLKLDATTLRNWETHYNSKEFVEYDNIIAYLRDQCAVLQSIAPVKSSHSERYQYKVASSHAVSAESRSCYFCDGSQHSAFQCQVLRKMNSGERMAAVRRNMLCFNCLSPGHGVGKCSRGFCTVCKRKHHTLLHESFAAPNRVTSIASSVVPHTAPRSRQANHQVQPSQSRPQSHNQNYNRIPLTQSTQHNTPTPTAISITSNQPTIDNTSTCNSITLEANSVSIAREVLLSTAVVRVHDQFGHTVLARALLDSASQRNLITTDFAQKLRCKPIPDYLRIKGVGSSEITSTNAVVAKVSPRTLHMKQFSTSMKFHILSRVTSCLPCKHVSIQHLKLPSNSQLADPYFNVPGPVDMIIGAEHFYEVLKEERRKLEGSEAVIQQTIFGWIVSGVVEICSDAIPQIISNVGSIESDSTRDIQEQLTKFWELESCHVRNMLSLEESACEDFFKKTTYRDETGKFVVSLPKKPNMIGKLGESRAIAVKRFLGLERRLNANPEVKSMYIEFMHEYMLMGHMVKVEDEVKDPPACYVPHHAVIKPDSTTTKLRVVFDASCLTTSGFSLNDTLMVGPVVQDELYDINIRFRLHMLVIVADVAKMYRMVNMNPADQQYQLIVWRDSPDEPVHSYKLTTVTYGTASAPYLATKCLQVLAEDGKTTHPIGSRVIKKDFYVDDMLTGADSIEEAKQLVAETSDLMGSAGFILRKWRSNRKEVLYGLPAHLRDDGGILEVGSSNSTVKTLGILWDSNDDCYRFKVPKWSVSSVICKRIVLSDAARIFDPLGILGPIVIVAKIFLQDLWKERVDWDESLSEDLQNRWMEYRRNLLSLESISIPRWIGCNPKCLKVEIHGFSDASDKAYGACLYIRSIWDDDTITVLLLTAKSKVAPLEDLKRKKKKQSTPRLELSAALLMSHVYEKIRGNFPSDTKAYFWTDSMIVKCWLSSCPSRWQPFVANRVSEIQHLTEGAVWNHVPGIENPADIISRGMVPAQLQYSSLWWNGPLWLRQHEGMWPQTCETFAEDEQGALEEKKAIASCSAQIVQPNEIFSLRSSLSSITRLVAWLHRFAHNCRPSNRTSRRTGFLTYAEYDQSLMRLVALSQAECFPEELKELTKGNQVKQGSRLNSLNPKLVDGIIHVGGRLRNAAVTLSRKHPIILDHRHPLTTLILRDYHHKYLHAGQQLLISSVRERFWPLNIRRVARKVIHQCIPCFRSKPTALDQLMGDLPSERVNPAPPFLKVGVDYCGPFSISYPGRKTRPVKCFVVVFICLATKAIHLEVALDLTTQAFVAALRRFVARRSKPQLIMCDNATNFVGAKREVDELGKLFKNQQFQEAIVRDAIKESIEFRFIPARSPNFGGLWEAAVKAFKSHFKRTIGVRVLTNDEFVTVLVQIEACLNSRPLTPLSSDPNDLEVLTPGHFLVQRPLVSLPEPSYQEIPENRLSMWQRAQEFVRRIWDKWSTQYLSTLHSRTKWTRERNNLGVGTMVLLREENLPPLKWLMGRVTNVRFGSDGNVRVAVVQTKNGIYERGISKICILPIQNNQHITHEED